MNLLRYPTKESPGKGISPQPPFLSYAGGEFSMFGAAEETSIHGSQRLTRFQRRIVQRNISSVPKRSIGTTVKEVLLSASEFIALSPTQYSDYVVSAGNGTFFVEWNSQHHSKIVAVLQLFREHLKYCNVPLNHPALVVVPWDPEKKPSSEQRGDLYTSGGWPLFVKNEMSDEEDELTSIYRSLRGMR